MINENDFIQYKSVYSKEYTLPYKEIGSAVKDFVETFSVNGLTGKRNLFYTIDWVNQDADMTVTFFRPAEEEILRPEGGLKYQSYYVIKDMISSVVLSDFEVNMEQAYAALMEYARQKNWDIISPFYNETHENENGNYYVVKAAVRKHREKQGVTEDEDNE